MCFFTTACRNTLPDARLNPFQTTRSLLNRQKLVVQSRRAIFLFFFSLWLQHRRPSMPNNRVRNDSTRSNISVLFRRSGEGQHTPELISRRTMTAFGFVRSSVDGPTCPVVNLTQRRHSWAHGRASRLLPRTKKKKKKVAFEGGKGSMGRGEVCPRQ